MPRYKPYDYDQMLMVAVSLEDQLEPGTLEYAIHHVVEERLDLSLFDERYRNDETGRRAIDPKILLKIVLLGYARGLTSSRPLERACRENITFMALACNQKPDHSTIAVFISSMAEQIAPLFTQVLLVCGQEGLLGGTHFSLDGLKLSSNASKEWSGNFKDLEKKKEAIERKVRETISEHRETDRRERKTRPDSQRRRRERRIENLKKKAERIERFLDENKPKMGKRGKEVQSNVTDNDSAKMTSSHGVIQGYNANAVVDEDNQVVVHAEVFGDATDSTAMEAMLDGVRQNMEEIGCEEPLKDTVVSADTGYFSTTNLQACRDAEVDAYVPDPKFRERDVRFADAKRHRRATDKRKLQYKKKPSKWFTNEDFHYDNDIGKLVCPAGKELYIKNRHFFTGDGFEGIAYQAPARACRGCKLRAECLRNPDSKRGRQVHYLHGRRPGALTDEMREKIDTPEGRKIYGKRLAIVEPVFGNIRSAKRMDRFTLRGRIKVNIQWMLYCIVHNLEKIGHCGETYAIAT